MKTVGLFTDTAHMLFPGVDAQIFAGEQLMVMRVKFEKGATAETHSHHHEQLSIILTGKVDFTLGEETVRLKAGDALSIPGNVQHSAHALEETELIECFTPVRADLIERFKIV